MVRVKITGVRRFQITKDLARASASHLTHK